MAEFKRNFTKSRMNKDLDERMVPSGEYRDARNIEILSSDGSDVGTVQNCLGNALVSDITPGPENSLWGAPFDDLSDCVGAIEDDKTNSLYYLISGPKRLNMTGFLYLPHMLQSNHCSSDMIAEYSSITNETHPVMVDIYSVASGRPLGWVPAAGWGNPETTIGVASTECLRIGMELDIFDWGFWGGLSNTITGWPNNLTRRPIITRIPTSTSIEIDIPIIFPLGVEPRMRFRAPRVLNFNQQDLITGINIVDDMLFWTDNNYEPKKVNILRGKQGSIPAYGICGACNFSKNTNNPYVFQGAQETGTTHTELVVEGNTLRNFFHNGTILNPSNTAVYGIQEYVQEEHITVIKRGPLSPPRLEMYDHIKRFDVQSRELHSVVNTDFTAWWGTNPDDPQGPSILPPVGMTSVEWNNIPGLVGGQSTIMAYFSDNSDYRAGDVLLVTDDVNAACVGGISSPCDPLPFSGQDVRVKLKVINSDSTDTAPLNTIMSAQVGNLEVQVLDIDQQIIGPPGVGATWYVRLEDEAESLYELKFPKFGYRYKYEDGEYSAFSPFSEVAFLPQEFKYDPKKGYNLGMMNGLKQLFIKDFIPPNMPHDVVEVELLYKESDSPNIYTLRSFNSLDPEWQTTGTNGYRGFFEVKHDLIHAVVASNQLLRPWDNVPRMALGQEITGNRLIYGNYLQNYNMQESGAPIESVIKPSFKTFINSELVEELGYAEHSLKSMRTYQLGVVYKDFYGRETPVLSHPSGVVKVDAAKALFSNGITVEIETPPPGWAHSFKYFIKEISNEYYNLAMDRWYFADWIPYDGALHTIWLSFPSEDRNKVDEETTLILKKSEIGTGTTGGFVSTTPRYKILAIENEAPDFIKTTIESIGTYELDDVASPNTGDFYDNVTYPGIPWVGFKQMRMKGTAFEKSDFASLQNASNQVQSGSLFGRNSSLMVRFHENVANPTTTSWYNISNIAHVSTTTSHYVINIDGKWKDELSHFVGTSTTLTDVIPNIKIELAKKTIENRPEFDGRFFAKIETDGALNKVLGIESDITSTTNWRTVSVMDSYFLYGPFNVSTPYANSVFNQTTFATEQMDMTVYPNYYNGNPASQTPGGVYESQVLTSAYQTSQDRVVVYNMGTGSKSCGNDPDYCYPAGQFGGQGTTQGAQDPPYRSIDDWFDLFSNNATPSGVSSGQYSYGREWHGFWFIDAEPALIAHGMCLTSCSSSSSINGFKLARHGKGADLGESTIEISIAGVPVRCPSCDHWLQGADPSSWSTENKHIHDKLSTPGTRFRFSADPEKLVYEIYSSSHSHVWNYDSPSHLGMSSPNTGGSNNPGLWRNDFRLRRVRYTIKLIEPFTGANPVFKGIGDGTSGIPYVPCDYGDIGGTGPVFDNDQASERVPIQIQFVEPDIEQHESEYSENPAIWETEPKENVGLDIYHEIGGSWPVNMCEDNEKLYIQPGATVSMYKSDNTGPYTTGGWTNRNFWLDAAPDVPSYVVHPPGTQTAIVDQFHNTSANPWTMATYTGHQETRYSSWQPGAPCFGCWENDKILLDAPDSVTLPPIVAGVITPNAIDTIQFPGPIPIGTTITWWNKTIDDKILLTIAPPVVVPHATLTTVQPNNALLFWSHVTPVTNQSQKVETVVVTVDGCAGLPAPSNMSDYSTKIEVNNGQVLDAGDILLFTNPDGTSVTATVAQCPGCPAGAGTITSDTFNNIAPGFSQTEIYLRAEVHGERHSLSYYNAYSFGNGVESNRIRDLYNSVTLDKGVKASTTLAEQYKEERRSTGLIFSGLYNSKSGVNRLNQFIMAENITKDLNPEYGSIQKLHQRDTDLVTLCEDKVLKVLSHKDALYNADDTKNITATQNVLGNSIPFVGEYGISTNPESFASEAFRAYFTDKERGAVLRLSRDGLTPISDVGMKDWFADNLLAFNNVFARGVNDKIIGSYDRRRSLYNITHRKENNHHEVIGTTVSYSEKSGGWVSFKDFDVEIAISLNNEYYTGMLGKLWKQHSTLYTDFSVPSWSGPCTNTIERNSFHDWEFDGSTGEFTVCGEGALTSDASITLLFNDLPSSIKSFNTLGYEGSQSKVHADLGDNKHRNNFPEVGWYETMISTDQQTGHIPGFGTNPYEGEFINKEGKWFNYIIGGKSKCDNVYYSVPGAIWPNVDWFVSGCNGNIDTQEFATQGLGFSQSVYYI